MATGTNGGTALELDLLHIEMKRLTARASRETSQRGLVAWYLDLAPFWLATKPRLRRRLLLRTHQWIAERVMSADREPRVVALELEPDGVLARVLIELVPSEEREGWTDWIRLVVSDLKRALRRPTAERNLAWAHWLFLIPYSIPLSAAVRWPRA
jgi:hypothetical protein